MFESSPPLSFSYPVGIISLPTVVIPVWSLGQSDHPDQYGPPTNQVIWQNFQLCLAHLWTDFQSCLMIMQVKQLCNFYMVNLTIAHLRISNKCVNLPE